MGWAAWFAKARERHERAQRLRGGAKVFVLGAVLAGAGGSLLYSDTMHQLNGKPSTATLIEHIKECTAEYQRIGEDPRKDIMPCDAAEAFQRLIGANKIKVSHNVHVARVRFALSDGRAHEAKVDESKLGSYRLPVGTEIAVVYAPDRPSDVRAVLSWERIKVSLILLAAGLAFLMLVFAGRIAALYAWAFPRRTPDAAISPLRFVSDTNGAGSRMTGSGPRSTFGTRG